MAPGPATERGFRPDDQVAELDGAAIGKPHTHERALAQLRMMSGRRVAFHTAVAVVRSGREHGHVRSGDTVVVLADSDDRSRATDVLRLVRVP